MKDEIPVPSLPVYPPRVEHGLGRRGGGRTGYMQDSPGDGCGRTKRMMFVLPFPGKDYNVFQISSSVGKGGA